MHFKKPKKEKKEQVEKRTVSNTMQTTYNMFNDGMSISEIAAQRGLSPVTVESHLAGYVGAGELEVTRLVPQVKLDQILVAIEKSGQTYAARPVKDLLGEDYSFGEIKVALEYYKRTR